MGLLGDIFSTIDTKKRQLKGLLADPSGTVDMGVARLREDQQNLQNLFANAYPMAGDRTVLNSPEQIARFQREAADKGADMGLAAATVWHGSPHKFDKFDSSKIGTGEGAQAYGHGLYLAESPEVAGQYADNVRPVTPYDLKMAKQELQEMLSDNWKRFSQDDIARQKDVVSKYQQRIDAKSIYKVDLPDEHIAKMLDWDKPLSEQAPEVQKAMKNVTDSTHGPGTWDSFLENAPDYRDFRNDLMESRAEPQISELLRKQGIPGIRYLDGGSRQVPNIANKQLAAAYAKHNGNAAAAVDEIMRGVYETPKAKAKMRADFMNMLESKKTSNYVVFPGNEGLLNILERNGQPVGGLLK